MSVSKAVALALVLSLSSCATIMNKGLQKVRITSDRPATVEITNSDGVKVATVKAPGEIELKKNEGPYDLRVTAAGYETQNVQIESQFAGEFWANLILFPLGMIVDYSTETAWMLKSDVVAITFDNE